MLKGKKSVIVSQETNTIQNIDISNCRKSVSNKTNNKHCKEIACGVTESLSSKTEQQPVLMLFTLNEVTLTSNEEALSCEMCSFLYNAILNHGVQWRKLN